MLAMTDAAAIEIATIIGGTVAGVLGYFMRRLEVQHNDHAAEAAANEIIKQRKLDRLTVYTKATYGLSNSHTASLLKLIWELSRWKADQTANPTDEETAVAARGAYEEHMVRQSQVDAQADLDHQHTMGMLRHELDGDYPPAASAGGAQSGPGLLPKK